MVLFSYLGVPIFKVDLDLTRNNSNRASAERHPPNAGLTTVPVIGLYRR